MKEPTKVSAKISAGGQPTEEDIAALKASGVRKIINLRREGEQNQPLDPVAQGDVVRRAGMQYLHIPVDPKNLDPSSAAAVAKAIEESDGPVYVHCAAGGRAVTHALLADGKAQGSSADKVFKKAEDIGAPVTDEGFKAYVRKVAGDGK
ncbi:MAG: beta-lactamase hydrolase domain-containing protein, partial [Hyphomicrobiaceae bacterium]